MRLHEKLRRERGWAIGLLLAVALVVGGWGAARLTSADVSGAWKEEGRKTYEFRLTLVEEEGSSVHGNGGYLNRKNNSVPFVVSGFRFGRKVGLRLSRGDGDYSTFAGSVQSRNRIKGTLFQRYNRPRNLTLVRLR